MYGIYWIVSLEEADHISRNSLRCCLLKTGPGSILAAIILIIPIQRYEISTVAGVERGWRDF
ncbi:MAG: hypothetical protein PVF74_01470 [Anaerolineales bacterium]